MGSVADWVGIIGDWVSASVGFGTVVVVFTGEQAARNIKKPTHIPKKCILNDLL
jgi:hypothetical protein